MKKSRKINQRLLKKYMSQRFIINETVNDDVHILEIGLQDLVTRVSELAYPDRREIVVVWKHVEPDSIMQELFNLFSGHGIDEKKLEVLFVRQPGGIEVKHYSKRGKEIKKAIMPVLMSAFPS